MFKNNGDKMSTSGLQFAKKKRTVYNNVHNCSKRGGATL